MNVFDFEPTGGEVQDSADFASLVETINKLPSGGGATIRIRDNGRPLVLSRAGGRSYYSFLRPVLIRGEHPCCTMKLNDVTLNWGGFPMPMKDSAAVPFVGIEAGMSSFTNPSGLVRGDWLALFAEDTLSGMDPHMAGGSQHPYEIHRVAYVSGDQVMLERPVVDTMSVMPKLLKLDLMPGGGIVDLQLASDIDKEGTSVSTTSLSIKRTQGFTIDNVQNLGIGSMIVDCSARTRLSGFSGGNTCNNFLDYGLIVGIVHDLIFADSFWSGSRHVVTTGGPNVGKRRYGTPTDVVIRGVHADIAGDGRYQYYVFDTHSEGYGVRFESCSVNLGGVKGCFAFHSRARGTQFVNCSVTGNRQNANGNTHTAFMLRAGLSEIVGCRIEDVWIGINVGKGMHGGVFGGHRIHGNYFSRLSSACVQSPTTADSLSITANTADYCGSRNGAGSPFIPRTLINLHGGIDHRIAYNVLPCHGNVSAIHTGGKRGYPAFLSPTDVEIVGNCMPGYAGQQMLAKGPDPASTSDNTSPFDMDAWNAKVAMDNYV